MSEIDIKEETHSRQLIDEKLVQEFSGEAPVESVDHDNGNRSKPDKEFDGAGHPEGIWRTQYRETHKIHVVRVVDSDFLTLELGEVDQIDSDNVEFDSTVTLHHADESIYNEIQTSSYTGELTEPLNKKEPYFRDLSFRGADGFERLIREGLPQFRTDYITGSSVLRYTGNIKLARIVRKNISERLPAVLPLIRTGQKYQHNYIFRSQDDKETPPELLGKFRAKKRALARDMREAFATLPSNEYLNRIQAWLDYVQNYFNRQDPKYFAGEAGEDYVPYANRLATEKPYFYEPVNYKQWQRDNTKEFKGGSGGVKQEEFAPFANDLSNPDQGLIIGATVHHQTLGIGKLLAHDKSEVERDESGRILSLAKTKLEVEFPSGVKRILAKFCTVIYKEKVYTFE